VRDERPVTVTFPTGEKVMGYVMGADDYHWVVVDHDLKVHLVHKSAPCLSIESDLSLALDRHPNAEEIRTMTESFRRWVQENHFHDTSRQGVS